jgi:predicted nucleic acid-binding protein
MGHLLVHVGLETGDADFRKAMPRGNRPGAPRRSRRRGHPDPPRPRGCATRADEGRSRSRGAPEASRSGARFRGRQGEPRAGGCEKPGLSLRRGRSAPVIAVDTSALMAIALGEAKADACITVLEAETEVLISAGTVAEALIVAARRNVADEVTEIIDGLGFDVVTVTLASARRIAQAYERWGQGGPSGRFERRRLLRLRGRQGAFLPAALCRR